MRKGIIVGFLAGVVFSVICYKAVIPQYMINMYDVVEINSIETGSEIILKDGSGYYWERYAAK